MSKVDIRHHNATAEGFAVAVLAVIALLAGILVAPGAVAVFALDQLAGLSLDCAQLWIFAVLASAGMFGGLAVAARSITTGASRFFLVALGVAALLLVARFGFHAAWPRDLWSAFTRRA
jgi:hypothetical protein